MKRALILDLDNTIYPVSAIADHLFKKLFDLIDHESSNVDLNQINPAKDELTRRHFQSVADQFGFSPGLRSKGIQLLQDMTYDLPMQPFTEYGDIRSLPHPKFLVTAGFHKLQWSKIKQLAIEGDFLEVHVVDPETSTKKAVFADILRRHHYKPQDLLIIGDDPDSEIKAAFELGIDTFLFDPANKHPLTAATYKNHRLKAVLNYV
jgi:putative hydrolase of the HAD superfamily